MTHLNRSNAALVDWLNLIGPERTACLRDLVLLYKYEEELQLDVELAMEQEGFDIRGITRRQQALTEFEVRHESLGLPKQFGGRGRRRR